MSNEKKTVVCASKAKELMKVEDVNVRYNKAIKSKYKDYSIEGTKAHETFTILLQHMLKNPRARLELSKKANLKEKNAKKAIDVIRKILLKLKKDKVEYKCYVEHELNGDIKDVSVHGRCDVIIVTKKDCWIFDYKYGQTQKIPAHGNDQLMIYAVNASKEFYEKKNYKMHLGILQPRLEHYKIIDVTKKEIEEYAKVLAMKTMGEIRCLGIQSCGEACIRCSAYPCCKEVFFEMLKIADEMSAKPALMPINDFCYALNKIHPLMFYILHMIRFATKRNKERQFDKTDFLFYSWLEKTKDLAKKVLQEILKLETSESDYIKSRTKNG